MHSVVKRVEGEGFTGWFPGLFRFMGEGWENKSRMILNDELDCGKKGRIYFLMSDNKQKITMCWR